MRVLRDKVAVITGASSGIGRCIALRAAREGMKVVLAGINEANLEKVQAELEARGNVSAIGVRTDVSKKSDIEVLAERTIEAFGSIHVLFNNAGITGGGILKTSLSDWEWLMGVNLWSVIYGVQVFLPLMQSQGNDCHIVNTASMAGLIPSVGLGAYCVTKYGVVALTEALYQELGEMGSKIKVSVVCPSYVRTRIIDSARNRPGAGNDPSPQLTEAEMNLEWDRLGTKWQTQVLPPESVADSIFEAIAEEKLYVITHPESKAWIRNRMENILEERNPLIL